MKSVRSVCRCVAVQQLQGNLLLQALDDWPEQFVKVSKVVTNLIVARQLYTQKFTFCAFNIVINATLNCCKTISKGSNLGNLSS